MLASCSSSSHDVTVVEDRERLLEVGGWHLKELSVNILDRLLEILEITKFYDNDLY